MPSPRKKLVCLPAAGAGTKPALPAADAVAAVMFEYVVLVGTTQVPSARKNLAWSPLAGAGTYPAVPAASAVAPLNAVQTLGFAGNLALTARPPTVASVTSLFHAKALVPAVDSTENVVPESASPVPAV